MSSHPLLYAQALARCIQSLRGETTPRAELRAQLRTLKTFSRREPFSLVRDGDAVRANGADATPELHEALTPVLERMRVHGLRSLEILRFAPALELLRASQHLASEPAEPRATPTPDETRVEPFWHVRLGEAASDETGAPAEGGGLPVLATIHRLRDAGDVVRIAESRPEIASAAESAAQRGDAREVHAIVVALAAAARDAVESRGRAAWAEIISALLSLPVLQLLVQHLPSDPDPTLAIDVLAHAGENAGRALINHLMAAETILERRVYFDAIVSTRAGIPILLDALEHTQWYVVRNAAILLGHMRATEADAALVRLLEHEEPRVRKAAADALVMLGTPTAVAALQRALRDPSPEMRRHAASVFSAGIMDGVARPTAPLASQLEVEDDDDVRIEILSALGRLATPDAVQRLLKAIGEPSHSAGSPEIRIAAVEALAQARGHAAIPALRPLLQDAEPMVRTSVRRVVARLALT